MKKIIKFSFIALVALSLASCLKDKDYDSDKVGLNLDNAPKIIELAEASVTDKTKRLDLLFDNAIIDVNLVTVRLAAKEPASEDIIVLLDTIGSASFVDTKGDSNFSRLPSLYSLNNNLQVTIPKGSREGYLKIKTNTSFYNTAATYGINFKLKSVAQSGYTLSNNFNEFYTTVGAKNAYQGTYDVVSGGRYNFNGITSISYVYPQNPTLIPGYTNFAATGPTKDILTVDAERCSIGIVNLGGGTFNYRYIVTIPTGSTGIVDLRPTMQYSATFLAGSSNRDLQHATYNHATKTFRFGLLYDNNGGSLRLHDEVLTRQ